MEKPTFATRWPEYMPLPREDIFAIGVVALNYCQLENMFQAVFSAVTRLNDHQTSALFHRLANNVRKDVLSELLAKTTVPDELRELVIHFLVGFGRCADNRHFIMHSSSGGIHQGAANGAHGLVLERHSRAGALLVSYVTLEQLKQIADDIHRYSTFGANLSGDLESYAIRVGAGHPELFRGASPSTLLEKPPLPTPLSWHSPDDPKARDIPPAARHLISQYRIRDPE